jgi:hypothetical protein
VLIITLTFVFSSCNNTGNDPEYDGPFKGIWTKTDNQDLKVYVYGNWQFEVKESGVYICKGTYTMIDDTTIRIQITHEYSGGQWLPEDQEDNFTGTISGNTVTVADAWPDANGTYTVTKN